MDAVREAWTDERLDDLADRMDRGFELLGGDIRELGERMDARFAQVDRRLDQVDKHLAQVDKRLDQVDKRLDQVEMRFDVVDVRFEQIAEGFQEVDRRFNRLETRVENGFADLRREMLDQRGEANERMIAVEDRVSEVQRTMMLGFSGIVASILGGVVAAVAAFVLQL